MSSPGDAATPQGSASRSPGAEKTGLASLASFFFQPGPGVHVELQDGDEFQRHQEEMIMRTHGRGIAFVPALLLFTLSVLVVPMALGESSAGRSKVQLHTSMSALLSGAWIVSKFRPAWGLDALAGCLSQMGVMIMMLVAIDVMSCQQDLNPVQQHRTFVTGFLNVLSIWTGIGYVPFAMQLVVGTAGFCVWLHFHASVGFATVNSTVYGCVVVSASLFFGVANRSALWKEHKVTKELEQEREFLDDVQRTLHNSLSSMFDASGTCDAAGNMLSSTPQLQQLLGGDWSSSSSSRSCVSQYSSSAEEKSRLLCFLGMVSAAGNHNTQTLHTSFRVAATSKVIEAKVVGIKVPDRDGRAIAFLGFQAGGDAFEPVHSASKVEDDGDLRALMADGKYKIQHDAADGGESLFSLSLTEESFVGARGPEPEREATLGLIQELSEGSAAQTEAELDDEQGESGDDEDVSGAAEGQGKSDSHVDGTAVLLSAARAEEPREAAALEPGKYSIRHDAADGGESLCSPSLTEESFVGARGPEPERGATLELIQEPSERSAAQTGAELDEEEPREAAAEHHAADARACRSELLTASDAGSSSGNVQALNETAHAWFAARPPLAPGSSVAAGHRRKKKRVDLATSKLLLPSFEETPTKTVRVLVAFLMCQLNSRGRGCCMWHVQLAALSKLMRALAKEECSFAMKVNSDWQCRACMVMNAFEESDEEEGDVPQCSACGLEGPTKGAPCGGNITGAETTATPSGHRQQLEESDEEEDEVPQCSVCSAEGPA